jgi:hypothetical protein
METGWTEEAATTRSWMRFRGSGAVLISSSQRVADKAVCFECGAKLAMTPAELLKAAY